MPENIVKLIKKYWSILLYLFFGVLTTLVNYIVYLPLYNYCHFSAAISNGFAWVAAVIVAFVTNKPFVFKSYDWSLRVTLPELAKFVSCRLISGIMETFILWLTVDMLQFNGNIWKVVTSVFVILVNYVASKFIIFRKK